MNSNTPISGTIHALAFGGAGVLRHEGQVIFVPFTAPGDEVEVSITSQKKRFAFGRLEKVISPSPLRVTPRCPYFGTCGGCQLQHITYEAQLESKKTAVSDSLSRIGKVEFSGVEIEGAEKPYGYRERIALHMIEGKVGYYTLDNETLIEINECPIFLDEETSLFKDIRELARRLNSYGRIDVLKDKKGKFLLYIRTEHLLIDKAEEALRWSQKNLTTLSGVEISHVGHWGKREVETEVAGLKIVYSPKVFIQNNASQSLKIYQEIAALLKGHASILDLYSGIGISSLLLAQGGSKVESIESNPEAVDWARKNLKLNDLKGITLHCGEVERKLGTMLKTASYDAALINPPRQGIKKEVVEALKTSGIKTVIYVSCMPSTLARDVKEFTDAGYHVRGVKAFDMFPQTGHIETLLQLNL